MCSHCFIAMLFAGFSVDPENWESHHLDKIIFEGDSLYHHIVQEHFDGDVHTYLNHDDIPEIVSAFSEHYSQLHGNTIVGAVNNEQPVSEVGALTLDAALDWFPSV